MPVTKWTEDVKRRIAETQAATHARRKEQVCRVYDLKVVGNKLSASQKEALTRQFLEAKWLRNDCLAQGIDGYKCGRTVRVRLADGSFDERAFKALGSAMKQSVINQLKLDRTNLAKAKAKGREVGRLRFSKQVTCIPLKAHGTDWSVKSATKVKVQRVPGHLRVRGMNQLPENGEFANAKLVSRADGYHLLATVFVPKEEVKDEYVKGTAVGIDMGLKTAITLSSGEKINASVKETERLKGLQRKLSRQKKGSKRYAKTLALIDREYQKMSNRRDDTAKKVCASLLKNEHVFIQDEQISGWKSSHGFVRGGRTVQHSILGRIKSRLKDHPRVTVLPASAATTQTCMCCGAKTKHAPSKRTYVCAECGYTDDRDVHAAQNMVLMGIDLLPVERRDTLVERMSDLAYDFDFASVVAGHSAMKRETPKSIVSG